MGGRYLDSAESRTDHDTQHAAPRHALELPVSDLQPISDARSNPHTSDCGTGSAGRGSPADALTAEAAPAAAQPAAAVASHPFVFDAFRAVRLAKAHGKVASARRMLVELNAFEAAIELAETYAEGLSVVEEVLSSARCGSFSSPPSSSFSPCTLCCNVSCGSAESQFD